MSNLLLIAAPGAGKGLISEYLINKYGYTHMSTGNLLREAALKDKELDAVMKSGQFVSKEIVDKLFEDFLKANKDNKIVFEGYPRNLEQAPSFDEMIGKYDISIDKVIFIDIDKEVAEKRISGRLMCSGCDALYNKYFDDIEDNKCKKCGSELYTRNDDDLETYQIRYNTFMEKTYPLVDYYKNKGTVYTISNNGTVEEIYNQIDKLVD